MDDDYDSDVIAYLFAAPGVRKNSALEVITDDVNSAYLYHERESTSGTSSASQEEETFVGSRHEGVNSGSTQRLATNSGRASLPPGLVLRFNSQYKRSEGIVFGRDPKADVFLGSKSSMISRSHFALDFDDENRLIVRALDSPLGTYMIYNGMSDQPLGGRNVVLSTEGPRYRGNQPPPIIKIFHKLQFKLVVPRHNITSETYLTKVRHFKEAQYLNVNTLTDMHLKKHTSVGPTVPLTPGVVIPGDLMWREQWAKGGFAIIYYVWHATTREEYALKVPLPLEECQDRPRQTSSSNIRLWRKEAKNMNGLSHPNIVRLKHFMVPDDDRSPIEPQLYFEFLPNGPLSNYIGRMTKFHQEQVTFQILSALEFLHNLKPEPMVHRDIKLENVLVQHWGGDTIHVKLADFGLAKHGQQLRTFCGTDGYIAPEGYTDKKYGPLVDIWSLGLLVCEMVQRQRIQEQEDLQSHTMIEASTVVEFAKRVQKNHPDNDLVGFAARHMLAVDPKSRSDARRCLDWARQLDGAVNADQSGSVTGSAGSDDGDESRPDTPRAQPVDLPQSRKDSAVIRGLLGPLGDDSSLIDSLMGMVPSTTSGFDRLGADSRLGTRVGDGGGDSGPLPWMEKHPSSPQMQMIAVGPRHTPAVKEVMEQHSLEYELHGGLARQSQQAKSDVSWSALMHLGSYNRDACTPSASRSKRQFRDEHGTETKGKGPMTSSADNAGSAGNLGRAGAAGSRISKKAKHEHALL